MHNILPKLQTAAYRAAKTSIAALPPGLFSARRFAIYQLPLASSHQRVKPAVSRLTIRWFDVDREGEQVSHITDSRLVENFRSDGYRAIVAWRDDQPLGIAWIAARCFAEGRLGIRFELLPKEVWLFAAHVPAPARRQGIYGQLLDFACAELRQEGVVRLLVGVSLGNVPSQQAHLQRGAVAVGKVFAVRTLGYTMAFSSAGVRRLPGQPLLARAAVSFSIAAGDS